LAALFDPGRFIRSRLNLRLLGRFEVRLGSGPPLAFATRKSQALLACLALRPGQPQTRERLAALLWGESDQARARQNLRQALTELRKTLKDNSGLLIGRDAVALEEGQFDCDVTTFEQLLAQGTPDALEQAIALYEGELLDGFSLTDAAYEEWLHAERSRLRTQAVRGLASLLARQIDTRQDEKAVRTATQLVELEPFHEPAHRALMRLHHRQGRRAIALRQYQLCVRVLQRELGTEPEESTRLLYQEIVARQPGQQRESVAALRPPLLLQAHDAPLVGREAEMTTLREAVRLAWRDGGRSALVLGEAGIGKSRLTDELAAFASASGGRVFAGRSFELEQLLPFRPWADALRAGHIATDCPELADFSPVWRAALTRLFPDWETAGAEADMAFDDPVRLYDAVAQLLGHLAKAQPILFVLEDLHWADESSLRLLAYLNHRIASAAVLLVATARDDEPEASPVLRRVLRELGSDSRGCRLTLAPLSRAEMETLVHRLLRADRSPAAVKELVERIWSMSEGSPFVTVEAVRALGHADASAASASLDLPERVRDMIAARLELLDEDARELAATAAVIGRELDFDVLQNAVGIDANATARALEKLVRRGVLQPVGERFAFVHERIREVVTAQLLQPHRRLLHQRVAEAIERFYVDSPALHLAALGAHFEEAGAWQKAVDYLRRAGIQAHERSANREAAVCFERALRLLDQLPRNRDSDALAIDLRLDLQSSLILLGELPRIVDHLREARAVAEATGDQPRLGRVLIHATHCAWWLGDCDAGVESGTAAESIARESNDVSLQIMANYRLGQVYLSRGEYQRARELFRRALALLPQDRQSERFGMPSLPAVVSRTFLTWTLVLLGEFNAARATAAEGARIAELSGHPYSTTIACRGVALTPLAQSDYPSAIAPLERALEICQRQELPFMTPWIAGDLGRAYALCGRTDEAVALLERTAQDSETLRMMMIHPRDVTALAEAYLLACRRAEAKHTIDRAVSLARAHKQRGVEAEALKILGDTVALEPDGRDRAAEAYRDSLALADALGQRGLVAECHLAIGSLCASDGSAELAQEHLRSAAVRFRELEMGRGLEQANARLRSLA